MNVRRTLSLSLLLAGLMVAAPKAGAQIPAADLLKWAPADADLVGSVNLRSASTTPLFRAVLDSEFMAPELNGAVELLRLALDASGANRPENGAFWGRKGDADSAVVVITGNLNRETFIADLKARPDYATRQQDGLLLHRWIDNSGSRHHYAAFLNPTTLALSNRTDTLIAAYRAGGAGGGFVKAGAASMLPADKSLLGYALMRSPERLVPAEYGSDSMRARAGLFTLKPADDKSRVEATVFADSAESAKQWNNLAAGMVALLPWQMESPAAAAAIRDIHLKQRNDNTVSATLTAPQSTLVELMRAQ